MNRTHSSAHAAPVRSGSVGSRRAGSSPEADCRSQLREALGPTWQTREGWDPAVIGDRLALSLCLARDRITIPLARAAWFFIERREWITYGFARIDDHARERFGRCGRWVRDLAALAEAAERLPDLAGAMSGDNGGSPIGRVAALLIGRIAAVESCKDWITLARSLPVRELRREIERARRAGSSSPVGDRPSREGPTNRGAANTEGANAGAASTGAGNTGGANTGAANEGAANTTAVGSMHDPDLEPRCTIRLALPLPVSAAFDEARDLYSAISGGQSSLTDFVEALVAEACAGPVEPVHDDDWRGRRPDQASRETAFAKASGNWEFLHRLSGVRNVLVEAEKNLREVDRLCREAAEGMGTFDGLIRSLTRLEDEIESRIGEILAVMGETGAWRGLLFTGVGHYAEERLGIARTTAEDRARLARTLRDLPTVREAYREGRIGGQAAALIRRILATAPVDARLEASWVEHAERTTIKRLQDELRIHAREMSLSPIVKAAAPADDAVWHASLSRRRGQAIERVAHCGKEALEAFADPVVIPLRLPNDIAACLLAALSARRRTLYDYATAVPRDEPWPDSGSPASVLAARTFSFRGGSVPEWVAMLAMIEDFVATWDDPRQSPTRKSHEVYIRDGWRCSAPGCTSRQNLEDHHVVYRSRGGSNEVSNRTCLCRFHHQRGEHGSLLTCRGEAPLGLVWYVGRNRIGGVYMNERRLE